MRLFKVGTILQIIYLVCCTFVVVCMPLYSAFYTTTFGLICFKMGAVLTFVSTFNPVGLIGSILNIVACAMSNLKKSKKTLDMDYCIPCFDSSFLGAGCVLFCASQRWCIMKKSHYF